MADVHHAAASRQLRILFEVGTVAGQSDAQLLERFVAGHDAVAFETLLARHGPMVLSVCRGILVDPRSEWPIIAEEPATVASIYVRYLIPLVAIPSVFGAIGSLGIGAGLPVVGAVRFSLMWAVRSAALLYVERLIAIYLVALVIAWLAPLFGGQRNLVQGLKVSAYSAKIGRAHV